MWGVLAGLLVGLGCAGQVPLVDATSGQDLIGQEAYVQFNLHPDRQRKRLYTLNYQLADAMIPRCAKVRLLGMTPKVLKFVELDSGTEFQYIVHRGAGEPLEASAAKAFGARCDTKAVERMSKADREGIRNGALGLGMTREGVLLAAGYPPKIKTPSLDGDEWTFWKNRFNTFVIRFGKSGKIEEIRD